MKRAVIILTILLVFITGGIYAFPKVMQRWYSERESVSIVSDSGHSYEFISAEDSDGTTEGNKFNTYQATADQLRAAPALGEKGWAAIPKDAKDAARIGATISTSFQNSLRSAWISTIAFERLLRTRHMLGTFSHMMCPSFLGNIVHRLLAVDGKQLRNLILHTLLRLVEGLGIGLHLRASTAP